MDDNEMKYKVKKDIVFLIENEHFVEAKEYLEEYKEIVPDDIDIHSMESIIYINENDFLKAEETLNTGLNIDKNKFDLNYNMAYLKMITDDFSEALNYYKIALKNCVDENLNNEIEGFILELKSKVK